MKKMLCLILVIAVIVCVGCLAACDVVTNTHEHSFGAAWVNDAEGHWHQASCEHTDERGSWAAHRDGDNDGLCDVCGYRLGSATVAVESVRLDKATLNMVVGSEQTLVATVLPGNATDKSVIWSSSDTVVATVDENGKVSAVAVGSAVITVTAGGKSATCQVTVSAVVPTDTLTYEEIVEDDVVIGYVVTGVKDRTIETIEIPAEYNHLPILKIGDNAFEGCSALSSVKIPDCVISIGDGSFMNCNNLTIVIIGKGVVSFGDGVFLNCDKLATIRFEGSAAQWQQISKGSSWDGETGQYTIECSNGSYDKGELTDVAIDSVRLDKTTLSLVVGDKQTLSVTVLPANATDIVVSWNSSDANVAMVDDNGKVTALAEGTAVITATAGEVSATCQVTVDCLMYESIVENEQVIGYTVKGLAKPVSKIVIPAQYNGLPVMSIGDRAFNDCSGMWSVKIGNGVTSIGDYAFYGCSGLASVTIGNGVTSIGRGAFFGCESLTYITIPSSVTSIGGGAFGGCSMLSSVTISDSVTSIGDEAFDGTDWYDNQSDGLVYVGKVAYKYKGNMKDTSIVLEEGTRSIADWAFYTDGRGMLKNITIPDSVISIGQCAFRECGLTSVTIPRSVTSIGDSAFYGCSGLTSIAVASDNTTYHSAGNCVIETASRTLIAGCKTSVIPTDGSVTAIGDEAFFGCESLTNITIPSGVTSIGAYAFSRCSMLTSITIPNSVTSIGDSAFDGCSGLTSVTIPDSVTSIGGWAFYDCSGLKTINYVGTVEQWQQISKESGWNDYTGKYTVACIDGTIAKNGTVTPKE